MTKKIRRKAAKPGIRRQEKAIDQAIGVVGAALRRSICYDILVGSTDTPIYALESFIQSVQLGYFPRWEVLEIIAAAAENGLKQNGSPESLSKAFGIVHGKAGRHKSKDRTDVYGDIANRIVTEGLTRLKACERVVSHRRLGTGAKTLSEAYGEAGGSEFEKIERRRLAGESRPALEHLKRAIRRTRKLTESQAD